MWLCRCDCGTERRQRRNFVSLSCGCYQRERASETFLKHGASGGRRQRLSEYNVWLDMLDRCRNPKNVAYRHYGGRGVKVCERWRDDFKNFLADVGERPDGHTLDRIDNDGDYEPSNCRWATQQEQCRNTRRNVRLTFNGETMTVVEWTRRLGFAKDVIGWRLKSGWSIEKALTTPVGAQIGRPRKTAA